MVSLEPDGLLAAARVATGLDDFGPDSFRPGLEALVAAAEREARLSDSGRAQLAAMIGSRLQNRLRLYDWHSRHPEIAQQEVPAPIFVIGLWRTGTTIMSYLLAQDPSRRSLLRWEAAEPAPPPGLDPQADSARIDKVASLIGSQQRQSPRLAAINIQEPDGPTECVLTLSHEFKSQLFDTMLHIPSYYRWNRSNDQRSAYEHHRATLQLLQWKRPPTSWHLKAPAHTLSLEALASVYPDARFVVVHRDPVASLASACDFWELQMRTFSDDIDLEALGKHWLDIYSDALRDLGNFLAVTPAERALVLRYSELHEPLSAVERMYRHLDIELTDDARQRMTQAFNDHRPGRHGKHDYTLERFGLTETEANERLAPFVERAGLAL
jgi:hypothetical protein